MGTAHLFCLQNVKKVLMNDKSEIASKFIGTWRLASVEARRPNGEVAPTPARYGTKTIGYLMYDATGHVAVQIMRPDRPKFAVNDIDKGTAEELKAAWEGYSAYFGTYEINGSPIFPVEDSTYSGLMRWYVQSAGTLRCPERAVGRDGRG